MNSEADWDKIVAGLRSGDPQICREFWLKYSPLLEGVAFRQLSSRVQRRVGPDDVVQSACRTFFRRVSFGQFDLPDADALWRLICAITVTKARRVARDQSRKKRGLGREEFVARAVALSKAQALPDSIRKRTGQAGALVAGPVAVVWP